MIATSLRVPLGIALAILVCSAHTVQAQCPFPHPARAKKFRAELVQAFIQCAPSYSGEEPNAVTESGVPSCYPAETFGEQSGSSSAWVWGPKSGGSVALTAKGGDIVVSAQMRDVRDNLGPVTGEGRLVAVVRVTLYDPGVGKMTVIDAPLGMPFPFVGGKGKIKTTLAAAGLPASGVLTGSCRSIEVIFIGVHDAGNHPFADGGVYLP